MRSEEETELERTISAHLAGGEVEAAVTEALRGFGAPIFGYLLAVLHEEDAAAEVYAQAGENIWKGIGGFKPGTSFRAWAYRVAWNAAMDHLRARRRRRETPLASGEQAEPAAPERSSTASYLRTSVRDRILALRRGLTPAEQTLLTLRVDRRFAFAEIATVLDARSEAALRKQFERVKVKLRRLAQAAGIVGAR
jgi:RNA polymerase sigma-70 factor (ECF subfamily)